MKKLGKIAAKLAAGVLVAGLVELAREAYYNYINDMDELDMYRAMALEAEEENGPEKENS